jgi:hypothetical protein
MDVQINWTVKIVYNDGKDQAGQSQDGVHYLTARTPEGQYEALLGGRDGKQLTLGTFSDAYWACVDHNWSMQTPEVQATRHGSVRQTRPAPPLCSQCFTEHAGECL